ncbi:hypothetical protein BCR43DRAFT_513876 [Syncephalastrum racemosum]|uniref:BZIP domain-containing protein n=1 Tax=Syncephalastrum racemosum TaxID=13706 RepID=A0A1X2HET3_SYNRA|nr:hypothetical protein BCR43DRAFT_513876 [Syncephalastrum racemosum]
MQTTMMDVDMDKNKWDSSYERSNGSNNHYRNDGSEDSVTYSEGDGFDDAGRPLFESQLAFATPQDIRQRRKEQNRAAQRAFRERKERYVKELEIKIQDIEKQHETHAKRLEQENQELRDTLKRMESEIYTLRGAAMAFETTMARLHDAGVDVPLSLREMSPPASDHSPKTICEQASHSQQSVDCPLSNHTNTTNQSPMFAESKVERFDHTSTADTDVALIPCTEVWDRLTEHPAFEDMDVSRLCEEVKKKAKCSGSGPVIDENDLQDLIQAMIRHNN